MLAAIRSQLQECLYEALKGAYADTDSMPSLEIDVPTDKQHGDFSSNIALKSAKVFKKSPMVIAESFLSLIKNELAKSLIAEKIHKVEIKHPGFINFYLSSSAIYDVICDVLNKGSDFGKREYGGGKRVLVEFVSANPTGPLSVAHARQAAIGDSLVNILNFSGYEAQKEYYVNDGGNQINILGESIKFRALEILGEAVDFIEDGYQGDYIKIMAQEFLDKKNIHTINELNAVDSFDFRTFGKDYLLDVIRQELDDFRVTFDTWSYESQVATRNDIEDLLDYLEKKGLSYESEGALWFKTTQFGDDKDRVIRKSDGSFTYLTPDIVYHKNKYDRGFDQLIDILGPDHHGYISRLKAAAQALGKGPDSLNVEIVQLATIYRSGEKVSMSTRGGQYISLREVIEEVGVDAARFFFLMRHMSMHLDFDLELAKKETADNPVFYIQYAYARINSINAKAHDAGIAMQVSNFSMLQEEEEMDLVKKISGFNDALDACCAKMDPYPLVNYLQNLAAAFHKFYDNHKVVGEDDVLSSERLALINAARIVLENGLKLLGLNTPQKM